MKVKKSLSQNKLGKDEVKSCAVAETLSNIGGGAKLSFWLKSIFYFEVSTKCPPLIMRKESFTINVQQVVDIWYFFISAVQLSQSAHFSLQLPYTLFGLGRSPNFVDKVEVGIPQGNGKVSIPFFRCHERDPCKTCLTATIADFLKCRKPYHFAI